MEQFKSGRMNMHDEERTGQPLDSVRLGES